MELQVRRYVNNVYVDEKELNDIVIENELVVDIVGKIRQRIISDKVV